MRRSCRAALLRNGGFAAADLAKFRYGFHRSSAWLRREHAALSLEGVEEHQREQGLVQHRYDFCPGFLSETDELSDWFWTL
jgi:hypothetical protein